MTFFYRTPSMVNSGVFIWQNHECKIRDKDPDKINNLKNSYLDECDHCDEHAVCVNGHCICDTNYVGDGLECWRKLTSNETHQLD